MLINPKRSVLYLTGFMGSGKSTIGAELAKRLGLKFFDLDVLIEEKAKKSIAGIFEEDGALIFRAIEAEVLKDISQISFCVVALGGGTILDQNNLELAKRTGLLICLEADTEITWDRIADTERRVLIEGKKKSDSETFEFTNIATRIELLKKIREPFYSEASLFIDTTKLTVDEVVSEILSKLDLVLKSDQV